MSCCFAHFRIARALRISNRSRGLRNFDRVAVAAFLSRGGAAVAATAREGQFRNPAGGGYGYYGRLCHALSLSLSLAVAQRAPRTSVISFGMWRLGKEGKLEEVRSVRPEIRLPDAIFVSISSIQIDTARRGMEWNRTNFIWTRPRSAAGSHLDLGARHSGVLFAPSVNL